MTSPFDFSRHPAISTGPYSLAAPNLPRAPIYNPYDKFTQPEFDAWIGGITGALKRALGQENEAEQQPIAQLSDSDESYGEVESQLRGQVSDEESVDDEVNDSFAEIRARRVVGKGKARDPRDGPGFGTGEKHQPIEIVSDSEEEEEQVEEEESEEEQSSEEWDEEEQSEEEEKEQPWSKPESSAQARIRHSREQLALEYEDEYEDDYEEEEEKPNEEADDEDRDNEEQEQQKTSSPIMVLDSDEEQGEDDEDEEGAPVYEYVDEEGSDAGYSDEDESTSMLVPSIDPSAAPPRHHIAMHDTHAYDIGLAYPEHESSDDLDEVDEIEEVIQPLAQDTSFPPHPPAMQKNYSVQIPDPWNGAKTYAQDYYSGGDVRFEPNQELTVDHLGAGDTEDVDELPSPSPLESDAVEMIIEVDIAERKVDEAEQWVTAEDTSVLVDADHEPNTETLSHKTDVPEVVDAGAEGDEQQPTADDTSFPPPQPSAKRGDVNIPDPWLMPSRFAEDYYAGGDVLSAPDGVFDPHHIGAGDEEDHTLTSRPPAPTHDIVEVVDDDEAQPLSEDTSFPSPQPDEQAVPINIPDHWLMPNRFAEDYYAGGDVRPELDGQLNPHHLGAGDEETTTTRTPMHVRDAVEVVGEVVKEDEQRQPMAEDTSFPPPAAQPSSPQSLYPIELPDAWYGPRTYAEDYYAGGDIRPEADGQLSPDHLGPGDISESPILLDSRESSLRDSAETTASVSKVQTNVNLEDEVRNIEAGIAKDVPKDLAMFHRLERETVTDAQPTAASLIGETGVNPAADHEELDLDGLYDDMHVDVGDGQVDLSGVDWEYASAFLNGLPTSAMDQVATSDGYTGDLTSYTEAKEAEGSVQQPARSPLEDDYFLSERATHDVAVLGVEVTKQSGEREDAAMEPVSEASTEANAEAVAFIEEAIASVEEVSSSQEPSSNASTPVVLQTPLPPEDQHHYPEYGLPTPPSEHEPSFDRPSLSQHCEVQDSPTSFGPEPAPAVESPDETTVRNTLCAPIIEEVAEEDGGGADEDAEGEIDLDLDMVPAPREGLQSSLTQETLVETESTPIEEHDATIVEHVTKDSTMDANASIDEPTKSVETNAQASASGLFEPKAHQLDETAAPDMSTLPSSPVSPVSEPDSQPSHSRQETISMPVCADPTIPDPTSRPHTPITAQPLLLSLPGTPNFMLSPAGTPGDRPTPVSVPVSSSVLKALKMHYARPTVGSSGLFTPVPVPSLDGTIPSTQVEENPSAPAVAEPEEPSAESAMTIGEEELLLSERSVEAIAASVESQAPSASPVPPSPVPPLEGKDTGSAVIGTSSPSMAEPPVAGSAASTSTPKPYISYNAPSSYPMRVVMRKATDPILFSDPYPYSLSTPGDFLEDAKDVELYEEETSQDNSTSSSSQDNSVVSSTGDKDLDDKENDIILEGLGAKGEEDVESIENMELRYPSVQPNGEELVKAITTANDSVIEDLHNDTDADGDLDPDFVVVSAIDQAQQLVPSLPAVALHETEPQTTTTSSSGLVSLEAPLPPQFKPEEKTGEQVQSLHTTPPSSLTPLPSTKAPNGQTLSQKSDSELPVILIIKKPTAQQQKRKDNVRNEESEELTDLDDAQSPAKPKLSHPSKRKRSSSITSATSPVTRSMSSKKVDTGRHQSSRSTAKARNGIKQDNRKANGKASVSTKSKGKSREIRALQASNDSFDTRSMSSRSSSGASTISRMLHADSRNTSRASSIISTAPSDKSSLITQPSPTLDKGTSRSQVSPPVPPPPPPLLHRHSHALPQHHQHRPPSTQPPPSRKQLPQKASSSNNRQSEPRPAPDASTSKPSASSQPGPSHRAPVYFSSPVTRSNCRYHKISIPREEDGPRIFFLVPGCSLGNHDFMKEEEIVDHGDATPEDGVRIVQDLDSLDFDPYLIGVLRLLCGVDLLREQEVYYLPQSGPELVPKKRRRYLRMARISVPHSGAHASTINAASLLSPTSSRAPVSTASSASTSGSDRYLRMARISVPHSGAHASTISAASLLSPTSSRAPVSTAGSASTSGSAARRAKDWEGDSLSALSVSENELSGEEYHPRFKRAKPLPVEGKASISKMGPPPSDKKPRKSRSRKSLRREDGQDEPQSSRRGHGKGTHGFKRSRTSEIEREPDMDTRKVKKQKTATSDHWKNV